MTEWSLALHEFQPGDSSVQCTILGDTAVNLSTSAAGGQIQCSGPVGWAGGANWSEANFFVADVLHHCHDVLVIVVTFARNHGQSLNDVIEVHFGILPGVPTRLCFPLAALNAEKLFMHRYPGTMQTTLRGGSGIHREEVDFLQIGTIESVSPRHCTLSNIRLTMNEPNFLTHDGPIVDALGQYTAKEWTGKTPDAPALVSQLHKAASQAEQSEFFERSWGTYGGWTQRPFGATGFFRTHHDGRRHWLVDPEGYAFLSTGFDCVNPGEFMKVTGMRHLAPELPAMEGPFNPAWSNRLTEGPMFSYAIANLIRAFGDDWWQQWADITQRRHREWGINTIGNWSQADFIRYANIPYVWPLEGFPSTKRTIFRDFPDVFDPEYQERANQFAEQLEPIKDDPLMIGYFLRNEPHFAFVDNLNIAEKMLENEAHFTSKERLIGFLRAKYSDSVDVWNNAWNARFTSFDDLLQPIHGASTLSINAAADLDEFSGQMVEAYVGIPSQACKQVDKNHLNLGMRYAWISSQHLLRGAKFFDVFSINCYQMKPDAEVVRRIHDATGLPILLGEFHHGAPDVGLLSNGIRGVKTQRDRGLAYRYFVEQAVAMPELVGMHYFQWNDQPLLGRFDGENYQIGIVDGCHQPYQAFVDEVVETHRWMYEVAAGSRPPYAIEPEQIPRTGF